MRVKRRIFSGAVCEQEIYPVSDRGGPLRQRKPRLRFKDEEERKAFHLAVSMRGFVRLVNANCNPSWLYLTLTFSDEHEVHTFPEARRAADRFVRRIRRISPGCEYILVMGRGKSTSRIHFHMLVNGVAPDELRRKWTFGEILPPKPGGDYHLREHNYYNGVDHGMDYTGLAVYLFNHWTEEQGEHSHRWRASRNLRPPDEREAPTPSLRRYTPERPPLPPPGYRYVGCTSDTAFGYQCFKYVQAQEQSPPRGRPPA